MNTSIMYSTIALGLAATLYAAENPALNIETGGTLLLDDFEDGDLVSKYGPWKFSGDFASANPDDGVGESAITPKVVTSEDEGHSGKILQIDYSLSKGTYKYDPFVQATLYMDADDGSYDISACSQIEYDYKGAAHKVRLMSTLSEAIGGGDWAYYEMSVGASKDNSWDHAVLNLDQFKRPSWTYIDVKLNDVKQSVYALDWNFSGFSGVSRSLQIDNVKCRNPQFFEISFYNGEELLDRQTVAEGVMPQYEGEIPEKASDEKFDYVFKGWEPELAEATKNTSYLAAFDAVAVFKIAVGETIVIDDFEDGDKISNWGGEFSSYDDEGVDSYAQEEVVFAGDSKNIKFSYKKKKSGGYAGLEMRLVESGTRNLSSCNVVKYKYKGVKHSFRLQSTVVDDYQYHEQTVNASEDWTTAVVELASLQQPSGYVGVESAIKFATAFEWQVNYRSANEGVLEIDDISCSNIPMYTVTFMDGENHVETRKFFEGSMPECESCEYWYKQSLGEFEKYDYTFNGKFSPELESVTKDAVYQMVWDETLRKYMVTFVDQNGEDLYFDMFEYGSTPKYSGETPTKPSDVQYDYTFSGWLPEIAPVTGIAKYKAQFKSTIRKYMVKFINDDKTEILAQEYDYGTSVSSVEPETVPTKVDSEGLITYTFDGWSPEFDENTTVEGDITYTATYKTSDNKYTIRFMNGDEVLWENFVTAGEMPAYEGSPTKDATAAYTYTFKGWDKDVVAVTKSVTYMAMFDSTKNKYTITFKDDNGTVLETEMYDYGTTASEIDAPNIVRNEEKNDEEFSWVWGDKGYYNVPNYDCEWPVIETVTGNATYTAQCKYRVTFVLGDYDDWYEYVSWQYAYGETPTYDGEPTKDDYSGMYTYTFKGWDKKIEPVGQHSVTYTAQFDRELAQYLVQFVVDDEIIASKKYNAGTEAEKVEVPTATKAPTDNCTYVFTNWENDWGGEGIDDVWGDVTYTAKFECSTTSNKVLVKFVVGDNVLSSTEYEYGTKAASVTVPTATIPATAQYTFEFVSWDKDIADVTEAVTYTAVFDTIVNKYTVKFVSEGNELSSTEYDYGTKAEKVTVPTATKDATAQYTYTFKSWDKEIADVTGNVTYTAVFEGAVNKYVVKFVSEGKDLSSTEYEYGTKAEKLTVPTATKDATAQYTYTFKSWDKAVADVTGDVTYTAEFESTVNKYVVKFVSENNVLSSTEYEYGTKAANVKVPTATKDATAQYTYTFKSWDKAVADVMGNVIYTAVFDAVVNKYTVKFVSEGKELSSTKYDYGTKAKDVEAPTATKAATAQYTYKFKSWDKTIADVKAAATYTAKFDSTVNKYCVKFVVEGKTVDSTMYAYGTKAKDVKTPKTTPEKKATAQYTYKFKSWDKTIADVKAAATYTAKFDSTVNKYYVKFVVEGKTVDSTMYAYGTKAKNVKTPKDTPEKKSTKDSTYTFDKWDPEIVDVKGNATYKAKFKAKKKSSAIGQVVQSNFKYSFANNELTVYMPKASMVRVLVYDLGGRLVTSFNEDVAGSMVFSLDKLKRGVYQVRIESKSQTRSARISVK